MSLKHFRKISSVFDLELKPRKKASLSLYVDCFADENFLTLNHQQMLAGMSGLCF